MPSVYQGLMFYLLFLFNNNIKYYTYTTLLNSGIAAFECLSHFCCFGCSKIPLINRFYKISSDLPVWFIIGKMR